jgi:hypothetical protein
MKSKALRWVALLGLGPILFGKTSRSETISHGVPPDPGNSIPQGSQAICPGVPDGVALIPGLRTGRAIAQSSSATVRLLFSDLPLACQVIGNTTIAQIAQSGAEAACASASANASSSASTSWAFSILLPPEMQTPSVYILADHDVGFVNSIQDEMMAPPPSGGCGAGAGRCNGGGFSTGGSGGGVGSGVPPGTVEIYSVTDQCITGRFQGLMTAQTRTVAPDGSTSIQPSPEINGAFHAVRCTP